MKRPSVITSPDIRLLWDAVEELTADMQGGARVQADLMARVEALEAARHAGFQPIPLKRGPGRPPKQFSDTRNQFSDEK